MKTGSLKAIIQHRLKVEERSDGFLTMKRGERDAI